LPPITRLIAPAVVLMALAACGTPPLPPEVIEPMRQAFDREMAENDPLCPRAGPFPFNTSRMGFGCERCEAMVAAGLLVGEGRNGDRAYIYRLTDAGRAVYRDLLDEEQLAIVRERNAITPAPRSEAQLRELRWPRMCFGRTRFHSVVDYLAPQGDGGNSLRSVKLVAQAFDDSGLLFDPRLEGLGLPLPPKPEAGQPILYPPTIVTFEFSRLERLPFITTTRYGKWVFEEEAKP
jgi:hypothetical protein